MTGAAGGSALGRDMQDVLDMLESLGWRPMPSLSPVEARQQPSLADAAAAVLDAHGRDATPPPVSQLEYRYIPGPDVEIGARIFTPMLSGPAPLVLYLPDGGWVAPDLDAHELAARALTLRLSAVVMLMNYRAAPEHRFPAAHDDAFAAYRWLWEHARHIGGDPDRIIVAGDGAGANMAANVAIRARDEGLPPPAHQLLICPMAGTDLETASFREHADARPMDRATWEWCLCHLLGRSGSRERAELNLASRDDLADLPAATVVTVEADPLRSDGEALAEALAAAGVSVRHRTFAGVTHGFFGLTGVLASAREALAFAADDIEHHLMTIPVRDTSVQPSVSP